MMKLRYFLPFLALSATLRTTAAEPPRLVVQIVVSSMRAEDLNRYADNFSDEGIPAARTRRHLLSREPLRLPAYLDPRFARHAHHGSQPFGTRHRRRAVDRLREQQRRGTHQGPLRDGHRLRRRHRRLFAPQSGGPDAGRKPPTELAQEPRRHRGARPRIGRRGRRVHAQRILDGRPARQLDHLVVLCRNAARVGPKIQPQPRDSGIHSLRVGTEIPPRALPQLAEHGHRPQQTRTPAPQTPPSDVGRARKACTERPLRHRTDALHALGQRSHAGLRQAAAHADAAGQGTPHPIC